MDEANGAAIPDPVELAIRQLLGDTVYQLAEGSPDGFWASNRLADCRAAIAAYADAERQAGWFAGLHAGQEQGRTNAAIEGAAQIDAYIASERLEAYNLGAAIEREATDTAYGDGRGAALAEIDAACERIAGADRHGNVNLTFWADDIGWEVGTDDTSKPIAGFPTPTAALLAALGVADDGGGAS